MTIIRNAILILLLLFTTEMALSQTLKLRKAADLKVAPSISSSEMKQIVQSVEAALNEYAAACKLMDLDKKRVTEYSIDRFNKLFTPNAIVVKDYAEFIPPELISYKEYAIEVFNMFQLKGIETILQSAELVEVKADALGFYIPIVIVRKKIFNSLSADGSLNSIVTGREMEQEFRFDVFKEDLQRASISRINHGGGGLGIPDKYTQLFSISVGAGSSSLSPSTSAYWSQAHSTSSLGINGGLNFSIGAELVTDKLITAKTTTDRKLALSLGLRYSSYEVKTELRSFGLSPFDAVATDSPGGGTNTNSYSRLVGPIFADEDIRFGVLEIPLGISYTLLKKQTSLVYLHARLIPSFVLSGSGNLKGVGIYDGILYIEDASAKGNGELSEFQIGRLGAVNPDDITDFAAFKVGEQTIDMPVDPELAGVTFALQLSPTAYFNFSDDNPGWGAMVGLDLSYHLGSFIKHNPVSRAEDEALKFADDFEGSLLNYYTDKISGLSFGLRLGFFRRLSIDP